MNTGKWMAAALVALSMGTAAMAAPSASEPAEGLQGPGLAILSSLQKLDLTDGQKHAIAVILKDNREDIRNTLQYFAAARKTLFEAIHAESFNEQAVRDASRVVSVYEEELSVVRARVASRIKQILTPEQKQNLQELKSTLRERIASRLESGRGLMDMWIEQNSAN
ncbi:MAG: Spy/CpxP family protein refolding chaperone [Lentisphaerota bacterium]